MQQRASLLNAAWQYFQKGNLPQAEIICRHVIRLYGERPNAYAMLGLIAMKVGLRDCGVEYFRHALQLDPDNQVAQTSLADVERELNGHVSAEGGRPGHGATGGQQRYLLIKAWGCGFWSDMNHVMGQLLLSEMTDRIPIVYWGPESLFWDQGSANAFEEFFWPVSEYGIGDIHGSSYRYFPPTWNEANLLGATARKTEGPYSRMAGLYLLGREEEVVVSDFHTAVFDLVPWIRPGHALYGLDTGKLYRYLFEKYISLHPDVASKVEMFWNEHMNGRSVLGVHVRGGDKIHEDKELMAVNEAYCHEISSYLSGKPDAVVFLLTDSIDILNEYQQLYGDRLIYTDCTRTSGGAGLHYQDHISRRKIGEEVVIDAYLGARCDYFMGYGYSNVSTSILYMKNWQPSQFRLFGENVLFMPNFYLHNW